MLSDNLGEKKIFSKEPEFLHMVFNVKEKTWSCIFVAGFCFVFELKRMQKNLPFPSHVVRSLFVEQQTGRLFIVYEVKIKSQSI